MNLIQGRSSILITGLEGSGKSYFLVQQVKLCLDNDVFDNIYCVNIYGLKIQHPKLHIVDVDFDWTKAPPNSLVVYDETQTIERFDNSSTKISSHEQVKALSERRHKQVTLVFMTQSPENIHSALRKLIKYHYHLSNPYSSSDKTYLFIFSGVINTLDNKNKSWQNGAIEEHDIIFDQDIFPLYKSVDDGAQHDKVKVVNKKARRLLIATAIALPISLILFFTAINFAYKYYKNNLNSKSQQQTEKSVSNKVSDVVQNSQDYVINDADVSIHDTEYKTKMDNLDNKREYELYEELLPKDYRILTKNDEIRIAAVISFNGKCTAYNRYGDSMNISYDECIEYSMGNKIIKARSDSYRAITDDSTTFKDF